MLAGQRVLIKLFGQIFILAFAVALICGCESPEERELSRGLKAEKNRDFKGAIASFSRAILRNPQSLIAVAAAKEGAKVAILELKDFKKATEFFEIIVVQSNDFSERISAQKQLATMYFDQLTEYPRAIEELNKLLATSLEPSEKAQYRLKLAKAYFFTNNFLQAESEANDFLKNPVDADSQFQMMVLKGNIYMAKKNAAKAIEVFKDVMRLDPERAVKENAAMILAVAYEELKDYKNAVSVLEQMKKYHPMPEYIDIRINKLIVDQKNQPGAKGINRK